MPEVEELVKIQFFFVIKQANVLPIFMILPIPFKKKNQASFWVLYIGRRDYVLALEAVK